ncbi:MAG: hypothetical protein GXO89_04065 [Chlorobi bacterium]|nr:hypothetical protein [Chlorobiota bacterium]
MKDITKAFATIIIGTVLSFSVQSTYADAPPDLSSGGPGGSDLPAGGGAPLSGGLVMLVSMGVAYGFKKVYGNKTKEK